MNRFIRSGRDKNKEEDYQVTSSWHSWWKCHGVVLAKTVKKSFGNKREREREREGRWSNDEGDGRGEREAPAGYERF